MKKIFSVLLTLAMMISFAACTVKTGDSTSSATDSDTTQSTTSEDTMSSQAPEVDTRYRATREEKPDGFKYKNVNILCVGDSITAGDGTPSGYRYHLYKYLYTNGAHFATVGPSKSSADVRLPEKYQYHAGVGGRKIQDVIDNLDTITNYNYDIILLMIGTNDNGNIDGATDRLKALIDGMITKNPNASIYVAEPIPRKGEKKDSSTSYILYNKLLPDICKEYKDKGSKVTFVDMKYDTWTSDCYNDTVHPNEKGNEIIGTSFGDAILDELLMINDSGDSSYVEPVHVSGIEISDSKLTLEAGLAKTISATVSPKNAEAFTVLWSSSDNSIATVSDFGKITAVKEGTATITAKSIDGGFEKNCTVTVTKSNEPAGTNVFKTSFNNASDWTGNVDMISSNGFATSWGSSGKTVTITSANTVDAGNSFKMVLNYQSTGNTSQNAGKRAGYSSLSYNGFEIRINNSATYIDLYSNGQLVGEYNNGSVNQNKLTIVFKYINGKATVLLDGEQIISVDAAAPSGNKNITARIGDLYRVCKFTSLQIDKF